MLLFSFKSNRHQLELIRDLFPCSFIIHLIHLFTLVFLSIYVPSFIETNKLFVWCLGQGEKPSPRWEIENTTQKRPA